MATNRLPRFIPIPSIPKEATIQRRILPMIIGLLMKRALQHRISLSPPAIRTLLKLSRLRLRARRHPVKKRSKMHTAISYLQAPWRLATLYPTPAFRARVLTEWALMKAIPSRLQLHQMALLPLRRLMHRAT